MSFRNVVGGLVNGAWSIKLATHRGTEIDNETTPPSVLAASPLKEQRYRARWTAVRPPIGGYNCFGHVFALRRTIIDDPSYVAVILQEDGYGELSENEFPAIGDVVVYYSGTEASHVGRIDRFESLYVAAAEIEPPRIPIVLSKFDSVSGEYHHNIGDTPFIDITSRRIFRDRAIDPRPSGWRRTVSSLTP